MLRRKQTQDPQPPAPVIESALCITEFRPGTVAPLVPRWQQLPLDHPTVQAFPEFFRGLARLDREEVTDG